MKLIYTFALSFIVIVSFSQVGLVASYPFNGNANDVIGNYNGSVNGATLTTDRFGNINAAYYFDGINDYINLGNEFDYVNRTVSLWVYINNADNVPYGIYSSDNNTLQYGNTNFEADKYSLGVLQFGMSIGGNVAVASANESQWYHLASTWNDSIAKFYVNGSLVLVDDDVSNAKSNTGTQSALLGCGRNISKFFNGKIDDVRIFNRALTDNEIATFTSIEEDGINDAGDLTMYYSNSSKEIVVNTNEGTTLVDDGARIRVFNTVGQKLQEVTLKQGINSITVGVNGFIIVEVTDSNGFKVVKKFYTY